MSDLYRGFTESAIGRQVTRMLGLPQPTRLERYVEGAPLVEGTVLVGGRGRLVGTVPDLLDALSVSTAAEAEAQTDPGATYRGLVFDATGLTASERLVELRDFFTPLLRRLDTCPRVVVLGTPPEQTEGAERVAQRALEGFTRSLGKEIGRGGTVQLVYVAEGAEAAVQGTLAFLLSPKSAYVSGQVVRVGVHGGAQAGSVDDWLRPLADRVALVTGASRGMGAQIARVLHRDGATVVGVDVPRAASELLEVMRGVEGDSLLLDITATDAPQRIARHLAERHGGVDVVVHNAGITRDRRLANMAASAERGDRFAQVVAVNLTAPERITRHLLDEGVVREGGSIVGVSSTSGIAGNVGQTNYATSKAGVIGLVDSLAGRLDRGITINAVAPGFIVTDMTAAVPFATREVGQRLNAMAQGGLPVDVAETVSWLASPASTGVDGNVVRVCGQMMLGA